MVRLFSEPEHLTNKTDDDPDGTLTAIDYEEQTAGYQAAYSRLAAAEAPAADPVAYVNNPREFLAQELRKAGPAVRPLAAQADQAIVGPFLATLGI